MSKDTMDLDKTTSNHHIKCSNINAVLNVDNATIFTNQQAKKPKMVSSLVDRFFSCFCILKNSEIITTNSLGTDSIEVIHGMR